MALDDGELLMDAEGNLIMFDDDEDGDLAMGKEDDECCCTGENTPPKPTCGSLSSCNNFCNGKFAFTRAETCACPCPHRKAYPTRYKHSISGFTLNPIVNGPDAEHYSRILDTGPFDFDDCGASGTRTIRWEKYKTADDTLESSSTMGLTFQYGDRTTTSCTDSEGQDITEVVDKGLMEMSGPLVFSGDDIMSRASAFGHPRCDGGTLEGVVVNTNVVGNPGVYRIKPTCETCDGARCCDGVGDPRVCGDPTYFIEVVLSHDGDGNPIYTPETGTLTKKAADSWEGGNKVHIVVETTSTKGSDNPPTENRCCPGCDCNECDDCAGETTPPNSGCVTCWIARVAGDEYYLGEGSCPPTGSHSGGTNDHVLYKDFQITGFTDCT